MGQGGGTYKAREARKLSAATTELTERPDKRILLQAPDWEDYKDDLVATYALAATHEPTAPHEYPCFVMTKLTGRTYYHVFVGRSELRWLDRYMNMHGHVPARKREPQCPSANGAHNSRCRCSKEEIDGTELTPTA